jgi:dihydrofolate reductase
VSNEGKLILQMRMSLDGFVCGPNGETDWMFPHFGEDSTAWILETLSQAGVHIMGRKTFRVMATFWPSSTGPLAPRMNEIPKVVFSRRGSGEPAGPISTPPTAVTQAVTHNDADWANSRVAGGDLKHDIAQLKREFRKPVLAHGGAAFAQSLVENGLIDEYRLIVLPIALGTGLRLFPEGNHPVKLCLMETKAFAKGTVAHVYRPV